MIPELQYLLISRDSITDSYTKEISPIRVFDTVFILKGQQSVVYTFDVIGRVFLNGKGVVKSSAKIKISDPDNVEIRTELLSGEGINAELGVNISAKFFLVEFKKEGRHSVEVSVNIDGGDFISILPKTFFWVKKML